MTVFLPEIVLAAAGMALLAADLARPLSPRAVVRAGLAASLVALSTVFLGPDPAGGSLSAMFTFDGLALGGRLLVLASLAVTLLLARPHLALGGGSAAEFAALLLFGSASLMGACAARHWIAVLILLETSSVALAAILGMRRADRASTEAALKYFILSSFATAFLVFGVAMWYFSAGTFLMDARPAWGTGESVALLLILAGLAFKCSLVPFHMWAPDVYEGGPTAVVAWVATASKVAGFAVLARALLVWQGALAPGMPAAMWGLAALSMAGGTMWALTQTGLKRLLAYSGISQAGFLLTAYLGGGSATAPLAVLGYLAAYTAMTMGAFAVVACLEGPGTGAQTGSLAGLGRRAPLLAGSFAVLLVALTGVPPTAGFIAKFLAFREAVWGGNTGLVILAVLATVVSAGVYIRLLIPVFMEEPDTRAPLRPPPAARVVAVITALFVLISGLFPALLTGLVALLY